MATKQEPKKDVVDKLDDVIDKLGDLVSSVDGLVTAMYELADITRAITSLAYNMNHIDDNLKKIVARLDSWDFPEKEKELDPELDYKFEGTNTGKRSWRE